MSEMYPLILGDSLLQHIHGWCQDSLKPDVIQPGAPHLAPGGHGGAPGHLQQEAHLPEIVSCCQSFVVFSEAINCHVTKCWTVILGNKLHDLPFQNKEEVLAIVPLCDNLVTSIKFNFFQGVSNSQALPFIQLILKWMFKPFIGRTIFYLRAKASQGTLHTDLASS